MDGAFYKNRAFSILLIRLLQAPELLLRSDDENETDPPASSTKQTDIYALGMVSAAASDTAACSKPLKTMLETITGKVPYAEYRKDMGIYGALTNKQPPARPSELLGPDVQPDQMWHLLLRCWDHNPTARPNALSVLTSVRRKNLFNQPDRSP